MSVIKPEAIKDTLEELVAKYEDDDSLITFGDVMASKTLLDVYKTEDALFGGGNVYPTASTPASGVASLISQYLETNSIDALEHAHESIVAEELYDLYMKKSASLLYALFSSIQEVGRKYGGLDPESNQITNEAIQPSFMQVANAETTTDSTVGGLPAGITGSFKNPMVNWKNTLSNSNDTEFKGWIDHYFTIDSSIGSDVLYEGAPALDKTVTFIAFGLLDRIGNVSGLKYATAKNNYSKPIYYTNTGLELSDTSTQAHVLNNGMSIYVGQSTYAYMGIDLIDGIPSATGTTTVTDGTLDLDVQLLGQMFAISPTIQNNKY